MAAEADELLFKQLSDAASAGVEDRHGEKEAVKRFKELAAKKNAQGYLELYWWLAAQHQTEREVHTRLLEGVGPEVARAGLKRRSAALDSFVATQPPHWSRTALRQATSLSTKLQLRLLREMLNFSRELPDKQGQHKRHYELLLEVAIPYTRFFEIELEKENAHVVICVALEPSWTATPVWDAYEARAMADLSYDKERDGELFRIDISWIHEVRIVAVCKQGAVRQWVDRELAFLELHRRVLNTWCYGSPVRSPGQKAAISFWQNSIYQLPPFVPLLKFEAGRVYDSAASIARKRSAVEQIVEDGKVGSYDHSLAVLQKVLCTDDYCRQLVDVVEASSGIDLTLSPQEQSVLALPSNVLLIGRSGTGKTTCAVLRLWAKYRQLAALRAGGDSDIDAAEGLPFNGIFVTLSPVLSAQVKKYYCTLTQNPETASNEADEDTLRNSLRASGHEDLDDELDTAYSGASLLEFYAEKPVFCSVKELLFAVDGCVPEPFFARGAQHARTARGWAGLSEAVEDLEEDSDAFNEVPEDDGAEDLFARGPGTRRQMPFNSSEFTYELFGAMYRQFGNGDHLAVHPSVVWTEIFSRIKGSLQSLAQPKGYLSRAAYMSLGRKQCPLTKEVREIIYDVFSAYEEYKGKARSYFDIPDVVAHIYRQIRSTGYHGPPIHSITIDEVQDFSVSTLQLLMEICKVPGGFFCTGDSAQTIARGSGFRFSDLRTVFYHRMMTHRVYRDQYSVPDIHQLTTNYRSHRQLHNMAHSVVHVLEELFPSSIDKLEPDCGTRDGPKPVFLSGGDTGSLFELLFGRQAGAAQQFGARQVIIVRNEGKKRQLPEELQPCLCLTVFEAKGLEFDDVILFDFFSDSSCGNWDPIATVLPCDPPAVAEPLVQTSFDQLDLDEAADERAGAEKPTAAAVHTARHRKKLTRDAAMSEWTLLCSELKHLYTAITRARNRLVVYERYPTDNSKTLVDYWSLTNLLASQEEASAAVAPDSSTEEERRQQWRQQGLEMLRRSYFAQALKCFTYSGDTALQTRCKAFYAANRAVVAPYLPADPAGPSGAVLQKQLFEEAAEFFKQIDFSNRAAQCLASAGKYDEAGELYEKAGHARQAAAAFSKCRRWADAARCATAAGDPWLARDCLERAGNWAELMASTRSLNAADRLDVTRRCTVRALWHAYRDDALEAPTKAGGRLAAALSCAAMDGATGARAAFVTSTFCCLETVPEAPQLASLLLDVNCPCLALAVLKASGQAIPSEAPLRLRACVAAVHQLTTAALRCREYRPARLHEVLVMAGSITDCEAGARVLGLNGHWVAAGTVLWKAGRHGAARDLLSAAGEDGIIIGLCGPEDAQLHTEALLRTVGTSPAAAALALAALQGDFAALAADAAMAIDKGDLASAAAAVLALAEAGCHKATLLLLSDCVCKRIMRLNKSDKFCKPAANRAAFSALVASRARQLLPCVAAVRRALNAGVGELGSGRTAGLLSSEELDACAIACQLAGIPVASSLFGTALMRVAPEAADCLRIFRSTELNDVVNATEKVLVKTLNFLFPLTDALAEVLDLGKDLVDFDCDDEGEANEEPFVETALSKVFKTLASALVRNDCEKATKEQAAALCHRVFASGRGQSFGMRIFQCLAAAGISLAEFYARHFQQLVGDAALAAQCQAYLALQNGDVKAAWGHWLDSHENAELNLLDAGEVAEWKTFALYACVALSGAADSPCDACSVPASVAAAVVPAVTSVAREEAMDAMLPLLNRHCSLTARALAELEAHGKHGYRVACEVGTLVAVLIYNCGMKPAEETGIQEELAVWFDTEDAGAADAEAFVHCCHPTNWATEALEVAFAVYNDPLITPTVTCDLSNTQVASTLSLAWGAVRRGPADAEADEASRQQHPSERAEAREAWRSLQQAIGLVTERKGFQTLDGSLDLVKLFQSHATLRKFLALSSPSEEERDSAADAVRLVRALAAARQQRREDHALEAAVRQQEEHKRQFHAKEKNRKKQAIIEERKKLKKDLQRRGF